MSEDKIWYIALNEEQVGPLSDDEVRAEIEAGNVTGSTYIWKDGLDDWITVFESGAFEGLVDEGEPDIADVAGESVDAFFANFGGGTDAEGEEDGDDLVAASLAASVTASPSIQNTPVEASPVASRSDDSVLFSLDELAATTRSVTEDDSSTTDGSGLIDLSALATTSATVRPRQEAATSDGGSAAPVAPAASVVALAPPKKSAAPMIIFAIAALLIVVLLGAIIFLLAGKDEPETVATAPDAVETEPAADAEAEAAAAAAAKEAEEAAAAEAAQAAAEEPEEPEAPEAPEEPEADERRAESDTRRAAASGSSSSGSSSSGSSSSGSSSSGSSSSGSSSSGSSSSRSSSSRSSSGSSSASGSSGGGDSVSAALAAIQGGGSSGSSSAPAAATSSGADAGRSALSDSDIRNTVRRYNRHIQACRQSDADAGTYRVSFSINPDGSTSGISPQGGGDVGTCVARVVNTMRFPAFSGAARQLNYTFAIR